MTLFASAIFLLVGIIDQMDSGVASVEWEGEHFGFVPTTLLPKTIKEGDQIVLRLFRHGQRGQKVATLENLELPTPVPQEGSVWVYSSQDCQTPRRVARAIRGGNNERRSTEHSVGNSNSVDGKKVREGCSHAAGRQAKS